MILGHNFEGNILNYPWYKIVHGDEIKQGDIIENCPVFYVPEELALDSTEIERQEFEIGFEERNVIVLSQTCDMVKNQESISDVLLCAIWLRTEITEGKMSKNENWENARKGRFPGFHVLNKCDLSSYKRDYRMVDFRRIYSLPLNWFRKKVSESGDRIRLLPPYREHLSQAFARFFMRVGLPVDIKSFTQTKRPK